MDRREYLRETSEALRRADDRNRERGEASPGRPGGGCDEPGANKLDRFSSALQAAGLEHDGERWQCPSCRSQHREPDFVLEMRLVGKHVEMTCTRDCRPNTIRALLGAPPYFRTGGHAKPVGRFPFR